MSSSNKSKVHKKSKNKSSSESSDDNSDVQVEEPNVESNIKSKKTARRNKKKESSSESDESDDSKAIKLAKKKKDKEKNIEGETEGADEEVTESLDVLITNYNGKKITLKLSSATKQVSEIRIALAKELNISDNSIRLIYDGAFVPLSRNIKELKTPLEFKYLINQEDAKTRQSKKEGESEKSSIPLKKDTTGDESLIKSKDNVSKNQKPKEAEKEKEKEKEEEIDVINLLNQLTYSAGPMNKIMEDFLKISPLHRDLFGPNIIDTLYSNPQYVTTFLTIVCKTHPDIIKKHVPTFKYVTKKNSNINDSKHSGRSSRSDGKTKIPEKLTKDQDKENIDKIMEVTGITSRERVTQYYQMNGKSVERTTNFLLENPGDDF